MEDTDQILIKMNGSPYYVVQPPLYDWENPDTKAHIEYISKMLFNADKSPAPEPKLLEPWKYRLAAQYNKQYNEDNNIEPFVHSWDSSEEDS